MLFKEENDDHLCNQTINSLIHLDLDKKQSSLYIGFKLLEFFGIFFCCSFFMENLLELKTSIKILS
jgi:hypothetical protein